MEVQRHRTPCDWKTVVTATADHVSKCSACKADLDAGRWDSQLPTQTSRLSKLFEKQKYVHGAKSCLGHRGPGWYNTDHTRAVPFVFPDGGEEWTFQGKKHREDDKPAVTLVDGTREWWFHGNLHRDGDKPARIMHDGSEEWWQLGKRHRDGDKPAVVLANGQEERWLYGRKITVKTIQEAVSRLARDEYHNMMPRFSGTKAVYAINGHLLPCLQTALEKGTMCTLPTVDDLYADKYPELRTLLIDAANACCANHHKDILNAESKYECVSLIVDDAANVVSWNTVDSETGMFRLCQIDSFYGSHAVSIRPGTRSCEYKSFK